MARPSKPTSPAGGSHEPVSLLSSKRFLAFGLLLLTLAAYSNSFGLGLVLDASSIVTEDTRIRSASVENVRLIFATDYWWPRATDPLYRPLTTLSFLFNYAVLGDGESPAGYHWVNFLLHLSNVWLAFAIALRCFNRVWQAFGATALWAIHPISTETVANVAGRADLLATGAILGCLLIYLDSARRTGSGLGLAPLGMFAVAVAALLSKESAAVLIGLMLLCDVANVKGSLTPIRSRLPYYAAAAGALVLVWWARTTVLASLPWAPPVFLANPLVAAEFGIARLTAIKVIGQYLGLLVWPATLSSDRAYDATSIASWTDPAAWLAVVVIASILAATLIRYRRDRLNFWAVGFFAIALLPTANLLVTIGSIMAERFLYLPAFGFAVAVVALAGRFLPARTAMILLGSIIAIAGARTWMRNSDWRDNLTLARADVTAAPRSYGLQQRLANALYEHDPRGNLDRAIHAAENAWRIQLGVPPEQRVEQNPANLGAWYREKGDLLGGPATAGGRVWYERALEILERGVEISNARERAFDRAQIAHGKPPSTRTAMQNIYFNLGAVNAQLGRYPQALNAYRFGRDINPRSGNPYPEIAAVHAAAGDWRAAAVALHEEILVEGPKPDTINRLQALYEGRLSMTCATSPIRGAALNYACPPVREDVCSASADLEKAYVEARQPQFARDIAAHARQYGCDTALP